MLYKDIETWACLACRKSASMIFIGSGLMVILTTVTESLVHSNENWEKYVTSMKPHRALSATFKQNHIALIDYAWLISMLSFYISYQLLRKL